MKFYMTLKSKVKTYISIKMLLSILGILLGFIFIFLLSVPIVSYR